MLDASHVEMPPLVDWDLRSFFAAGTAARPSTKSRLMSCPEEGILRANAYLARFRRHHRPIRDRLFIPFRPRPFARLLEQLSNEQVLIVNRRLGVDGNELEDDRQRIVLLNDTTDELPVTLERIFDVRHILARFVVLRRARGGDAFAAGFRRHREVENNVRP